MRDRGLPETETTPLDASSQEGDAAPQSRITPPTQVRRHIREPNRDQAGTLPPSQAKRPGQPFGSRKLEACSPHPQLWAQSHSL